MEYEWDEAKRRSNLAKHGPDFVDADLVIESPYVLIVDSSRRGEARQLAFAYVFEVLTVLAVAFVPGRRCRVISFRRARSDERKAYHEWLETNRNEQ